LTEGGSTVVVSAIDVEESAFLSLLFSVGHVVVAASCIPATSSAIALFVTHHTAEKATTAASFSIVASFAVIVALVISVVSPDRVGCGSIIAELAVAANGLIVVSYTMVGSTASVAICIVLTQSLIIVPEPVVAGCSIVDNIAAHSHILVAVTEAVMRSATVHNVAVLGHWSIVTHALVCGSAATEMAVPIVATIAVVGIIVGRIIAATEQTHLCVLPVG
jgi:hypothetical protein